MVLVTSTNTGLASSRYGRYSTPKRIKNSASEAARLMVNPTPRSTATLSSMRALGHSWRCTGKSFSKVPKSKVCIGCLDLTRAREKPTSDHTTVKKLWASVKTISASVNIANEARCGIMPYNWLRSRDLPSQEYGSPWWGIIHILTTVRHYTENAPCPV